MSSTYAINLDKLLLRSQGVTFPNQVEAQGSPPNNFLANASANGPILRVSKEARGAY